MITPPDNIQPSVSNACPSPQLMHDNCQTIQKPNIIPLSTTVSVSEPLIDCKQTIPLSNVFDKLTDLEVYFNIYMKFNYLFSLKNAISNISNHLVQT
jgi:hypothetical protein